jgi:hypothetical protein
MHAMGGQFELTVRFRVPKDVLVYSRDEVARWKTSPNHMIRRVLQEGRVLYGDE